MRLGFTPFPISPRNSAAAVAHLLKSTNCRHLALGQDVSLQKVADTVCHQFWEADVDNKITTIPMPRFNDLFSTKPGSYEPLPPVRPDWSQTALIMHSSGTTRFPSPIYATHKHMLHHAVRPCRRIQIFFFCSNSTFDRLWGYRPMWPSAWIPGNSYVSSVSTCGLGYQNADAIFQISWVLLASRIRCVISIISHLLVHFTNIYRLGRNRLYYGLLPAGRATSGSNG